MMTAHRQLTLWDPHNDARTSHDRLRDHIQTGDRDSVDRALRGAVMAHLAEVFGGGGKVPCSCGGTARWLAPWTQQVDAVQVACPRCGRNERVSIADLCDAAGMADARSAAP